MAKLKADKPSGPDNVALKLLKFAGGSIIPYLLSHGRLQTFQLSIKVTMKTVWGSCGQVLFPDPESIHVRAEK